MDVLTEHGRRTSHRAWWWWGYYHSEDLLTPDLEISTELLAWVPAVSREQGGGAECALASCYVCF